MTDANEVLPRDILELENTKLAAHGQVTADMTDEERIIFIRWNVLACTDELHEALGEVGWKPWASSNHINREPFLHELVDAQLFLHNLMLSTLRPGESVSDLQRHIEVLIVERIRRAVRRQTDGYDGLAGKCEHCRRDLGDVPPVSIDGGKFCGGCGHFLGRADNDNDENGDSRGGQGQRVVDSADIGTIS